MREYSLGRVLVGRLETGVDLLRSVNEICDKEGIRSGQVSIIGALRRARLGWFDFDKGKYVHFDVGDTSEILHCGGNVSLLDGRPFVHLHIQLGIEDRRCIGGHVFEGCEVKVAEAQILAFDGEPLTRVLDEQTGLRLWPR